MPDWKQIATDFYGACKVEHSGSMFWAECPICQAVRAYEAAMAEEERAMSTPRAQCTRDDIVRYECHAYNNGLCMSAFQCPAPKEAE